MTWVVHSEQLFMIWPYNTVMYVVRSSEFTLPQTIHVCRQGIIACKKEGKISWSGGGRKSCWLQDTSNHNWSWFSWNADFEDLKKATNASRREISNLCLLTIRSTILESFTIWTSRNSITWLSTTMYVHVHVCEPRWMDGIVVICLELQLVFHSPLIVCINTNNEEFFTHMREREREREHC